jgi:acetyl-CoA carboxylase, biotin carboxylase subunit
VRKVLVANRGEIAVRVIRACRDLGIRAVAVYSDCDRTSLHVRLADEAWPLGGDAPRDTYLRIDKLLDLARRAGADAVHPGYGFLAENPAFARAVRDAGLTFVGPGAEAIAAMGSKTAARAVAAAAGVEVVPGTREPLGPDVPEAEVRQVADAVGWPLMLKAVAGGGGKGMRLVSVAEELSPALRAARSEALSSFGDARVYLERHILSPRHVEVQLLGDHHGTVVPFVERECSIQRRHQKVLEESPSTAITAEQRRRMADAARRVAASVGYSNAGTIEFLLDDAGRFYFLEVNARLQVEHPVTEVVTGTDLVRWQLRIARGERLTLDPDLALTPRGHAIEARIYAEDPDNGFLPSPGLVTHLRPPSGPGIRDDTGLTAPWQVPIHYDPLVSKLIAWGVNRDHAISRLGRALREYEVEGIRTTIPFFRWLLVQEDYLAGRVDTEYLDRVLAARRGEPFWEVAENATDLAAIAAAVDAWARTRRRAAPDPGRRGILAGLSGWAAAARRGALR